MSDQQKAALKKAIHALGEHFDSVQIFVTTHLPAEVGGTFHATVGVGNWYSRVGQIKEWVIHQDEAAKCEVRRNMALSEDDDDSSGN